MFGTEIQEILETYEPQIRTFSVEMRRFIMSVAETGTPEALRQEIEYAGLGGDY
jgi:hypothetical protein